MSEIKWKYYPLNMPPEDFISDLISIFEMHNEEISSLKHGHKSNDILAIIADSLIAAGYSVERGKRKEEKIRIPVLFGLNGKIEKNFDADAFHQKNKIVLEVEAGRGVTNNQFLKDYFQACMMIDIDYFSVAVRNSYSGRDDFSEVIRFFDALYASGRIITKLKGVLIIGY